ncbi:MULTISPECIES: AimR family lysis-lysogeny pheromone receptor [Bacillus]|uniref:AimR family lysis-lysogeny pheromone receptor n=1 Tax=Bacillus TaxID=1386 RepID=UPI001E580464|nr:MULTISPECIES: AimR family lysis-lysogeny pheromone receptor [Bacillus]MCC8352545.1 AimR family lysis-lysogeny pheromone receptor [Bacillus sp. AF23]MCY8472400.1 AimR family lysis-lysogeny pheromone receptor [Bacillus halotolerans]
MGAIQQDVLNCFDDMFLDFEYAANKLDIHVNQLYNFKRTGKIGFRTLLKLSQMFYKEEYHILMREWCMKLTTTEAIKHAFEYAAIKRDLPLLKNLLNTHRTDTHLIKYTQFYQVIYNYMLGEINPSNLQEYVSSIKYGKDKELKILKDIFVCYCYYFENKYVSIVEKASDIEKELYQLSDARKIFFKECYLIRLSEVLAPAYLYLKDLSKCRRHAEFLFSSNLSAKTNSDGYYYMGASFLGESREMCLHYLRKSAAEAKRSNDIRIIKESDNTLKLFEGFYSYKESGVVPLDIPKPEDMLLGRRNVILRYFQLVKEGSIASLAEAYRVFTQEFNFLFSSIVVGDMIELGLDPLLAQPIKDIQLTYKGDVFFEKGFINSFTYWSGTDCG